MITLMNYFFFIKVCHVSITGSMHPSAMFIKSLVYKKVSPGSSTINIKTFITNHVRFGSEIKCYMGINIQYGVFGGCFSWGNCKPIRTRKPELGEVSVF